MKKLYYSLLTLLFLFVNQISVNAQTLPSANAEVTDVQTSSATFVDVTGASVSLSVTAGDKVMVTSSIIMNLTATASQDAAYLLVDVEDASVSDTIVRTANEYKGAASNVYVFTVGGTGTRTFKLQQKVAGGVTLNTTASLAAVVLNDGTAALQADVKSGITPISTSSTTWAEVTGSATTPITTGTSGGFVLMASVQSVKIAGATATGEWKLQYKEGAGSWMDLGYAIQRTTSGTGKGVANLVAALGSATSAGTYYFRLMHRVANGGGEEIQTQACNLIAVSFAHSTSTYQVIQGAKSTVSTTSNVYSDALSIPLTTNAGVTPKLLMLGQFNMEANAVSNAPKYDFSINDGVFYGGVDHGRYLSSHSDLGSAAIVGLTPAMSASTSYNFAIRHASNPNVPIRHIETSNILCVGVGLQHNAFVVYPITVNATLGTTSANYSTLKEAFDAINIGTHKGEISININSSTTETATALLYQSKKNMGGGKKSDYNSIVISPTSQGLSIRGNFAAPLIQFDGADNVTIDGRVNFTGNTDLTIEQQNTTAQTLRFINSAVGNTIQYSYIKGANTTTTSGVVEFGASTGGPGNDDNFIQNNKITCSGANKPVYTIYSHGSSGVLNTGNQILNNEFYDLFGSWAINNVIFISSYSTEFTVSGNSFYETATVTAGTGGHYSFIHLENTAGNGFVVSNNYLGGSAPLCGGSPLVLNSAYATYYENMDIHVGIAVAAEIYGNTVSNINYSSAYDHPFIGIEVVQGNANVHDNIVGSTTGSGSITVTNTTTDCVAHGIYISTPGDVSISGNQIGGMTTLGSATNSCSLVGIGKEADTGGVTISNNTIGNATADNMFASSASASATTEQTLFGIQVEGTGAISIRNNTIQNLKNAYAGTLDVNSTGGIHVSSGTTNDISSNYIKNISTASQQSTTAANAGLIGILLENSSSSSAQIISHNTIENLENTDATVPAFIVGISMRGGTATNSISSNLIHSFNHQSSGNATIVGVELLDNAISLSNNIIVLGENETGNYNIQGVLLNNTPAANSHDIYFNTIYIGGTVASGANNSACVYRNSDDGATILQYNILNNTRSGGTGLHYGFYSSASSITTLNSNYNDFWTGTASVLLNGHNAVDYTTLAAWQALSSDDLNSYNVVPDFDLPGGDLATDYFLKSTTSLPFIANTTGITVDYSSISRGSNTLVGALERHDYHWQGGTNTDFNTAANWDENSVPLPGANIIFNNPPANSCHLDADRVVGNIDISENTHFLMLNGHKLSVRGDFIKTTTNQIDADGASDVFVFVGSAAQTYPANAFINNTINTLVINNSSGLTLPDDITVNDLTLSNGALTIGANTLTINDAITSTSGTFVGGESSNITIADAGAVASTTLPAVSLNNLTLNRANGISLGGNVDVAGTLTLTAGTLTVGANTLGFSGTSVTRTTGGIDASNASATVSFTNAASVTLPASTFSAAVSNLSIDNTGGVVSSGDLTVNGELNLISVNPSVSVGLLDMLTSELTMGATATTVGLGDVEGIITRSSFPFNTNLTFGNQYNYFNFPSTGLTMPSKVSAKLVLSAPSWDSDAVLRTMSLIRTGGDDSVKFRGTIHYTDGELNGNAENRLSVWRKVILPPAAATELGKSGIDETDNWVSLGTAPLSLIKDSTGFGASEFCLEETDVATYIWDGSESTDWTDGNNWDGGVVPTSTSEVLIPDANSTPNDPILPASTTILSLSLENGAILNGGTSSVLTIAAGTGAFANSGGAFIPETSKLIFTNAAATWSGEMDLYDIEIAAAASIVPVAGAVMRIEGTLTNNGTLRFASVENTVEYNGANQTVLNPNGSTAGYYNLILSGSGLKTMPASALAVYGNMQVNGSVATAFAQNVDIDGSLTTESGTTVATGAFTTLVGDNATIGGTLTVSASGVFDLVTPSKELKVLYNGRVNLAGTLSASTNGYITLESKDAGTAQILNSGILTSSNSIVRLQKEMLQATAWYFMSFPYEVPVAQITDASTGDVITMGGASSSYNDIYVQEYDGFNRDALGAPSSSAGIYWADISPQTLNQNEGYIIATERDKTYYFSSLAGESDLFASTASLPVSKYVTNSDTTHHSWNLMGNPFSSGFDLIQASQDLAPFYIYNGYNYDVVMAGDNYIAYPFQAFFLQSFTGTSNTLDFATAGMQFRSAMINEPVHVEEIDLYLENQEAKSDRVRIRLRDDATAGFNPGKDALEFRSMDYAIPQLYAQSLGKNYAVHSLAPVSSGTMTIPLTMFIGKAGTYKIRIADAASKISNYKSVKLKDNTTGVVTELLTDSVYTFTAGYGTTTTRMALIIDAPTLTNVNTVVESGIKANVVGGKISFEGLNESAVVEVYDMTGKRIGQFNSINNYQVLPISLFGVYLLKVRTDSQSEQFKVLISNK